MTTATPVGQTGKQLLTRRTAARSAVTELKPVTRHQSIILQFDYINNINSSDNINDNKITEIFNKNNKILLQITRI